MPGENINTTLRFDADITDFSAAMQEARRESSLAKSEFNAVSSGMEDWSSSTEGLTAKLKQLSAQQQVEERRLEVLRAAYDKVVAEQGENSKAAVELKTKINNQVAAVNKAASQHDKFADKLEEVERNADGATDDIKDVGKAAKQSGDDAEAAGGGWTIMKDVIADFVSNIVSGAIDSLLGAVEATREYRREMAQLAQNAADTGVDMDVVKGKLADVTAVTGDAGAAMEGLNMLMASGLDADGITYIADALSGAALKFDGLSFEGIAEGLQETLATGEAVGPFAEMIERTGADVELFNAGLRKCTTDAEKQQWVMKWLAEDGLKDVHDSYVQNNADLVEAEKAQFRYNDSMAQIGAALEPAQTALTNLGATILEKIAPVVESIVTWVLDNLPVIEPIVIGIATALGVLAAALAIQGIISGVSKAFALLNTTMLANPIVLIVAAIAGLVAAFVHLWNNCEAFRNFWINLWETIKQAFSKVVDWFKNAAASIANFFSNAWQGIKKAWSAAGNFFSGVYSGIKNTFSAVGSWFGDKFRSAWNSVKNAWSSAGSFFSGVYSGVKNTFSTVGSWFGSKFSSAWQSVKNAWSSAGSFFSGVFSTIKSSFSISGMFDIGKNLVSGLWNGITGSVTWIKNKITGWVGDVLGFMKGLFGIHSPSTETEWQGEMLVAGYVDALKNGRHRLAEAMRGFATSGLDALGGVAPDGGGAVVTGGKTYNFYQTNNSPKALSPAEVYRQTNNVLSLVGGGA